MYNLVYRHHHVYRACFQHYVLQDAFFLSYYAQAYSAALDRCGGNPQPGSAAAAAAPVMRALLEAVDHELHLHASYAAGWGVDVSMAGSNVTPSAATSAYTDYLMDVADDPQVRPTHLNVCNHLPRPPYALCTCVYTLHTPHCCVASCLCALIH